MTDNENKTPEETPTNFAVKDMDLAREAFLNQDQDLSRKVHAAKARSPEKHGGTGSEFVKSIVFGGLDGIVTVFAVVASTVGADLNIKVLLLLGIAKVLSDGLSMGLGDYLSESAEEEVTKAERQREKWELENYPEGERLEMVELYKKKGMTEEHATRVVEILFKYRELFLNQMLADELGIMGEDDGPSAITMGFVTYFSFVSCGSVPLWFYLIFWAADWHDTQAMFIIACFATALALFGLGAFKARFTKQSLLISGFSILVNGVIATALAYLIGWGLQVATGADSSIAG